MEQVRELEKLTEHIVSGKYLTKKLSIDWKTIQEWIALGLRAYTIDALDVKNGQPVDTYSLGKNPEKSIRSLVFEKADIEKFVISHPEARSVDKLQGIEFPADDLEDDQALSISSMGKYKAIRALMIQIQNIRNGSLSSNRDVLKERALEEELYLLGRHYEDETGTDLLHSFEFLYADTSGVLQNSEITEQDYVFKKTGPTWTIVYEGRAFNGLRGNGFAYIALLVSNPYKTFHTRELDHEINGIQPEHCSGNVSQAKIGFASEKGADFGKKDNKLAEWVSEKRGKPTADHKDMIDGKCVTDLGEHYRFLHKELREAEHSEVKTRIVAAKSDLDNFIKYYSSFLDKDKFRGKSVRQKDAVAKSIERAVNSLKKYNEDLHQHFNSALSPIHSFTISYDPDRKIDWYIER